MPGIQRESRVLVDDTGGGGAPVAVSIADIVDTLSVGNSTTTPMLAGNFFNGVFESVLGFAAIVVTANSDGQAIQDGIFLEFSTNGVDVDYFLIANYRDTPGVGFEVTIPVLAQFFRIRWHTQQNQTWFRLETVYKRILAAFNPLTHIELPSPDNVVVVGANRGGTGPGIGISALTLWGNSKIDTGLGANQWGLFIRSQPGVLDMSQFLENVSGHYPLGAVNFDTISPLPNQAGGVLRCTPTRELFTSPRGTPLTPLTPLKIGVVDVSIQIVAANASRKGLRIMNTGTTNRLSLAYAPTAAVTDVGTVLYPGGILNMDEFDFTRLAINAICNVAGGTFATIQEFS